MSKDAIGKVYSNKEGYEAIILGQSENKAANGTRKLIGKFFISGYIFECEYSNLKKGVFKDYGRPTVYGVGFSRPGAKKDNLLIYKMWIRMLERCYNERFHGYKDYGGKGVRVDRRWHHFSNFEKDIVNLPNYEKYLNNPKLYSLDKDILSNNVKIYSKDTCMFADRTMQSTAQERVKKILCIPAKGEPFIANSKNEACRLTGVQNANLYKVLKGERSHAKGYRFKEIS